MCKREILYFALAVWDALWYAIFIGQSLRTAFFALLGGRSGKRDGVVIDRRRGFV